MMMNNLNLHNEDVVLNDSLKEMNFRQVFQFTFVSGFLSPERNLET
jgi:hypothetical protein